MKSLWKLDPARLPRALRWMTAKELHLWAPAWAAQRGRELLRRPYREAEGDTAGGTRHLLVAVCDHYEPLHGKVDLGQGKERVQAWRRGYPELCRRFTDAEGRPPRHSFFYPGEEYDPGLVEPIAELVEQGLGEVEVHLHHDGDTRASLTEKLTKTLDDLARHGCISRDAGGAYRWAFIHGNWALANGRRDGRWCGVDDELALLHELGCYVDYTFPSAPDACQPGIVNSIYYPKDPHARRAYEEGEPVRVGSARQEKVLLIQGPVALATRRRAGRLGVRIESSALDGSDPPSPERLRTWVDQNIHVAGRPEWVFLKLHTHGAPEKNAAVLLGEPMRQLHETLRAEYADGRKWQLHYVTAREMYNVARAAMEGKGGSPAEHYDHEIAAPPRAGAGENKRRIWPAEQAAATVAP